MSPSVTLAVIPIVNLATMDLQRAIGTRHQGIYGSNFARFIIGREEDLKKSRVRRSWVYIVQW